MNNNRRRIAELDNVTVRFAASGATVTALNQVSLLIEEGTSTAITGRSGSGKSTLIAVLTQLRTPFLGSVFLAGTELPKAQRVGIVFQSFHLEQHLSAVENIMLPWFSTPLRLSAKQARTRAQELLELVGIPQLAKRPTAKMSGGERQRVAIARSLLSGPLLLVADEPTGNLDEENSRIISDLLFQLPSDTGTAVVVVTHDQEVAQGAQRKLVLQQGNLSIDEGANHL